MKQYILLFILAFCITVPLCAKTWYISNTGADSNAGNYENPFKTISKGAEVAQAGDTVFVLAGIYRERVSPPRGGVEGKPIVYYGEPGKRVYIKGSDVYAGEWETVSDSVYVADLNQMQFSDDCYVDNANPFKVKVILDNPGSNAGTLGQVFVKSIPYRQMNTKTKMNATVGSWWYESATNKVWVHFSPQHSPKNTIELTTRRRIFAPHGKQLGLGYIHVEGFIMEHCGNQFPKWTIETMQAGALGLQSGHHWVVRNNVVRYAANAGIDSGFLWNTNEREGPPAGWDWQNQVRNNLIENNYLIDNGCVGICGGGTFVICRRNVVMWNNTQEYPLDNAEQGGIKFHGCQDGLIAENYVADNFAFGIWLDNQYPRTRVTRNVFAGNTNRGVSVEMGIYGFGEGALIDHNVIMDNHPDMQLDLMDASGCLVVNNLIAGDKRGAVVTHIYGEDTRRSDNNAFYNNIFCNHTEANISAPYPIARAGEQRFLGNLYDTTTRKMHINNFTGDWNTSPLSETEFRSRTADDAGTSVAALTTAGALATKLVKLNLDEWQTFWSKHTVHNDNDAEIMAGISAEFIPETQSVKLFLPNVVSKRLNNRWDTDYKNTYQLNEVESSVTDTESYPGPFDNLQAGVNEFKVYQGSLPVLARGELPGQAEPEEADKPYGDYAPNLLTVQINNQSLQVGDTTKHTVSCSENPVMITYTIPKYCTSDILVDGQHAAMPVTLQPGRNQFVIRVTPQENNRATKDYILEINKPLDIIRLYYDKVFAVNLNTETNGGFTFSGFQWQKNGQDIPGATGAYLYLSSLSNPADKYSVTLTTKAGDVLPTCAQKVSQLSTRSAESVLKIYPNPANANVTIENEDWEKSTGIVLYDKSGVKLQNYPVTGFQTIINVSAYPSGTYIVQSGGKTTIIIIK